MTESTPGERRFDKWFITILMAVLYVLVGFRCYLRGL